MRHLPTIVLLVTGSAFAANYSYDQNMSDRAKQLQAGFALAGIQIGSDSKVRQTPKLTEQCLHWVMDAEWQTDCHGITVHKESFWQDVIAWGEKPSIVSHIVFWSYQKHKPHKRISIDCRTSTYQTIAMDGSMDALKPLPPDGLLYSIAQGYCALE